MLKAAAQSRTFTVPGILLRMEGLAVIVGAIALYINQAGSGLMFALLLLAPDLGMVGYLRNARLGSLTYNAVHTYILPAILMALSLALAAPLGIQIALIWFAHIGMDRTLGFGLKYPNAFKDSHLGRI